MRLTDRSGIDFFFKFRCYKIKLRERATIVSCTYVS